MRNQSNRLVRKSRNSSRMQRRLQLGRPEVGLLRCERWCLRALWVSSLPGMLPPCTPDSACARLTASPPRPQSSPLDRSGTRPLGGTADAAELPGRAERDGEGPGVAERRLPHEPGAELQLACRARRHHRAGERAGALVPRGPRYALPPSANVAARR